MTTEDAEILVLSQDIVPRIMDKMPAIAARVLFNLSLILCARVGQLTRNLVTATAQPNVTNMSDILPGLVPLATSSRIKNKFQSGR
ncbi:MAG: hypothetical protein EXR08_07605 [Alphaproteobacteria bacterium]|nr:hypothetical protein [Alphaproteobacteria bacterium]